MAEDPGESLRGYMEPPHLQERDEDLLWGSQSGHWHLSTQAIRVTDGTEEEREELVERYKDGEFEMVPLHLQVRNRQSRPIRVLSDWDGQHLMLDVATTETVMMSPGAALLAIWRWFTHQWGTRGLIMLAVLLMALTAVSVALLFGLL